MQSKITASLLLSANQINTWMWLKLDFAFWYSCHHQMFSAFPSGHSSLLPMHVMNISDTSIQWGTNRSPLFPATFRISVVCVKKTSLSAVMTVGWMETLKVFQDWKWGTDYWFVYPFVLTVLKVTIMSNMTKHVWLKLPTASCLQNGILLITQSSCTTRLDSFQSGRRSTSSGKTIEILGQCVDVFFVTTVQW